MWTTIHKFTDIKYERTSDGIAKITINRPEMRNAFRPLTVSELKEAFDKAREIWFLCRQYDAKQALEMGLINAVVPLKKLEEETLQWCREMLQLSPMALRCIKAAMNADCDGQIGLLDFAGNATLLYYMSEEAQEGRNAFVERRKPDFKKFPRFP